MTLNSQNKRKVDVLVVDDHKLFRYGLIKFLKCFDIIADCDEVRSGELAIEAISNKYYPIVLLDRRMDGISGLETARRLKKISPDTKIIIMTGIGAEDPLEVIEMINIGIDGYIYKGGKDDDHLDDIITRVLNGGQYFNPEINEIYEEYKKTNKITQTNVLLSSELTKKEIQIIQLICLGLSSKQIAHKLNISYNTVNTHRQHILCKLKVKGVTGIMQYAIKNKLSKR